MRHVGFAMLILLMAGLPAGMAVIPQQQSAPASSLVGKSTETIAHGEISQTSIKCTLLRGFELELRTCFGRFQMESAPNPRD